MKRSITFPLAALLCAACSGPTLAGTWTLTTTPTSGTPTQATVVIGHDQLVVTTPQWNLTAQRAASTLNFTDNPGSGGTPGVVAATAIPGGFNAGVIPFDLGGTWTITGGDQGGSTTFSCTATVTSTEIDGSCSNVDSSGTPTLAWTISDTRISSASSVFGDFGGTWLDTATSYDNGTAQAPKQCQLVFSGSDISTCLTGGSFLQGISVTYADNLVSGTVTGAGEFSATLQ